ncbi:MAG TPA: DUF86 domain-containing protein [Geobacteraceae bacterium]|nr:DUF86 domain-containing protein [Geobacteraceae bacterium]
MPDKSLIMRKIAELELYMEQIGEFSGIGLEEYRREWRTQRIVERTLQIMIETCADIANHIIADSKMRLPTSYADTFRVLAENDMISAELLSVMEKMAKFRNIVVHQYDRVDAEIVMLILKKHLADFENFKNTILTLLKQKTP